MLLCIEDNKVILPQKKLSFNLKYRKFQYFWLKLLTKPIFKYIMDSALLRVFFGKEQSDAGSQKTPRRQFGKAYGFPNG
jgi:hypothetical protein